MPTPTLEFFSDLHCPHAYLTRYRLTQLDEDLQDHVRFVSRSLSIELDLNQATPKRILDNETPMIATLEDDLPYVPWPDEKIAQWPVTFLPVFEAIKAAETLDAAKAWTLDWRIREAFFAEHRCVSLRHVLADLAEDVGFPRDAFLDAFDTGAHRATVVAESREGWDQEGFTHSPSLRLPDGSTVVNPGDHWTEMDPERNWRVTRFDPGREDAVAYLESLLQDALEAA